MYLHQACRSQHIFSHSHFNILQQPHTFPCVVQYPEHNRKLALGSSAASDVKTLWFRALWWFMKGKSLIAFLVMQTAMPKMSKPNFLSANIHWKNSISDSNTHEHVRMANTNLHLMLSTCVQSLKCPPSWNSFLSSINASCMRKLHPNSHSESEDLRYLF